MELNEIKRGQVLPNWSIEAIFDEQVPEIRDYLGKPVLILLFSLGCPGCLGRAIPFANRMVVEHGEKLQVLGIHTNIEGADFTADQFSQAKEDYFIRFPFFKDKNYNTTFWDYGAGGTPHWFLINEQGALAYSIFGSDPNNALLRLDLRLHEVLNF